MEIDVMIPLIFAGLFLIVDVLMFANMIYLLRKMKDDTCENLGDKLTPYLYTTGAVSILMAICMAVATVLK